MLKVETDSKKKAKQREVKVYVLDSSAKQFVLAVSTIAESKV